MSNNKTYKHNSLYTADECFILQEENHHKCCKNCPNVTSIDAPVRAQCGNLAPTMKQASKASFGCNCLNQKALCTDLFPSSKSSALISRKHKIKQGISDARTHPHHTAECSESVFALQLSLFSACEHFLLSFEL